MLADGFSHAKGQQPRRNKQQEFRFTIDGDKLYNELEQNRRLGDVMPLQYDTQCAFFSYPPEAPCRSGPLKKDLN
jgi:hypothetical protein